MAAIEVEDLFKSYGAVDAVRGISFRVEEGEVFALLGPNGRGRRPRWRSLRATVGAAGAGCRCSASIPNSVGGACASESGSFCSRRGWMRN